MREFLTAWKAFRRDTRGAAAAEMGLLAAVMAVPMVNIADLGLYAYDKMQLENAAAAGAEAVWSTCNSTAKLPATNSTNCPGMSGAVTTALQSTSLNSHVTLGAGSPAEGYYCVLTTGALQLVGTAGTVGSPPTPPSPNTCDAVSGHSGVSGTAPGDYIRVTASYTYTPIFSGASVASLLPATVTKTTWSRLN